MWLCYLGKDAHQVPFLQERKRLLSFPFHLDLLFQLVPLVLLYLGLQDLFELLHFPFPTLRDCVIVLLPCLPDLVFLAPLVLFLRSIEGL